MRTPLFCLVGLTTLALGATCPDLRAAGPYPDRVGVGLGSPGGGPNRVFVDVMKSSDRWARPDGSPLDAATEMDSHGWPLVDFRVIVFDWRFFGAWLPPPHDDPERFQPDVSGTYTLSFTGQATIAEDGFTLENQVHDPATNTTTADLILPPGNNLLVLTFRDTEGGARNIRLLRPGYRDRPDQVFTDEFLNAVAPFSAIRFMDWIHTNNQNPDFGLGAPGNITDWATQRKRREDQTQMAGETPGRWNSVAWEYIIELCNRLGSDMWVTLPVSADDDYVRKLAILIKTGVDMGDADVSSSYDLAAGTRTTDPLHAHLKIYVEHSNEVWNGLFHQHAWNDAAALAEEAAGYDWKLQNVPGDAAYRTAHRGYRRHLKRSREIGQIFKEVFEPEFGPTTLFDKIRPVWSHWIGALDWDPNRWDLTAAWAIDTFGPLSDSFYGIGGAPYMNIDGASSTATPEQLLARMQSNSDASAALIRRRLIERANQWGLAPLCYEGGPDTGGGDTTNVQNKVRMHRLEGMRDLVQRDLADNWFERGGGLFMYFVEASSASRYGAWGALEDVALPDTPKYNGLLDLIGPLGLTLAPVPAQRFEELEDVALQLISRGGTPPLSWTVAQGALPGGLTLDPSSGLISGRPEVGSAGALTVTIRATDASDPAQSAEQSIDFAIDPFVDTAPNITTTSLPNGQVGRFYDTTLRATGGNGRLIWALESGVPPDGIELDPSGRLQGPPRTLDQHTTFVVRVTDSDPNLDASDSDSRSLTLTIDSQPAPVPPLAPTHLTARTVSNTRIDLSWTDQAPTETAYHLELSADGGQNFFLLTDLPAETVTYSHTGLASNTLHVYRVRASNAHGYSGFSETASATTFAPPTVPTITRQPTSLTVPPGGDAVFRISVFEFPEPSYQWMKGDQEVGVDSPILEINGATSDDAGTYRVIVTNSEGSTPSRSIVLGVKAPPFTTERLRNISTRGQVLAAPKNMIAGFVIRGTGQKEVLLRAIGPTLGSFGVGGTLDDPVLRLQRVTIPQEPPMATNQAWEDGNDREVVIETSVRVGAFPLAPASLDAVLHLGLSPGNYTAKVDGAGGVTGVALIEVYDADDPALSDDAGHVVNISTRGEVGLGASILIAGFVIEGEVPKQVLLRGIGPALGDFALTGTLPDPRLRLFKKRTPPQADEAVADNNDWAIDNDVEAIEAATAATGAFPLKRNAKDAALLLWLEPGFYTAKVADAEGGTGLALVEVYEVN